MLLALWLPIVLSAIALFFASFLSWVVFPLHKRDWVQLHGEDELLKTARAIGLAPEITCFLPRPRLKKGRAPSIGKSGSRGRAES